MRFSGYVVGFLLLVASINWSVASTIKVATYNVENYVIEATPNRTVKPQESRAKVQECIVALNADILALQEVGPESALLELREALKQKGLDYPHWEHVKGFDTNVFVAVLSKYPFAVRRPHTNESFLLSGRRFRVSRGFCEVELQIGEYRFNLFTAHLKSKRAIAEADESEMRLEEAKLLREKVDARLKENPNCNLVVLGDLNDTKDSASTRAILGRGKTRLVDTRPFERNGDTVPSSNPAWEPRNINWTHYFGKEDSFSRIDYILVSPGMAREWVPNDTYVLATANWGLASDHRPLVATFETKDK